MKQKAVFPGSFDPFTIGHFDLVNKAIPLFERIYIAVGENTSKNALFTVEQRVKAIQQVYQNNPSIEVITFSGLTVELCRSLNATYILRGLRNGTDFDYEKSIAMMNKKMQPAIETLFLLADEGHEYISSTIVREIYRTGGDISSFVPKDYTI